MLRACLQTLALLAACIPAAGISRRHDVPDEKYRKLAEDYPEVGRFAFGSEKLFGSSVLIAPRWIVLASHNLIFASAPFSVDFEGKTYAIDWCRRHLADLPAPNNADFTRDIAVCHLTEPVAGVRPARLYTARDEVGKEVTIVGFGIAGDGNSGADTTNPSGIKRAGQNRIDGVGTLDKIVSEDPEGRLLFYSFDAPPGVPSRKYWLGKSGEALPLEGMMTAGDSGGGVFVDSARGRYLIGLNSGCFGENGRPAATAGKGHTYGTGSRTVRISSFVPWVRTTIAQFESGREPQVGLAAHWSFDEATGEFAHDVSGVGHRGRISGARRVPGVKGRALEFDATGRVEVPNETALFLKAGRDIANDIKIRRDVTIAAWVRLAEADAKVPLVTKGDWAFGIQGTTLQLSGGDQGSATSKPMAALAARGTWQHVAATRTGEIVTFLLNGRVIGTAPLPGEFAVSDTPLRLAAPSGGLLDEVRVYRRALSADELRQLFRFDRRR